MRHTTKLLPVLLLGSAIGGCSMAGSGDYFADEYEQMQQQQMPYYYGGSHSNTASPCSAAIVQPKADKPCAKRKTRRAKSSRYGTPASYGHATGGNIQYHHSQFHNSQFLRSQFQYPQVQFPQVQYPQVQYPQVQYPQAQHPLAQYPQVQYPQVQHPQAHYPEAQIQYPQAQYGYQGYGYNPYGHGDYIAPSYNVTPYVLRGKSNGFEPHAYGNLGYVNYEAGEDLFGAQARLGYQINKYFGLEAEGSLGTSDDKRDEIFGGTTVEQTLGIKNSAAGFGVLRYPLLGKLSGYSRLGYHRTELDRELVIGGAAPQDSDFTVDGIAYGSGLEYAVSPKTAVRLDYTVYDYDGPDADAVSLALSRKF